MPGYIPTEMQGRTYASAQGNQAGSTIAQLEQRLRNMQWNGAPPIEMQNIQAEIDRLRRQQQTTLAKQQYDLQREVNRPVLGGIGGAQNQSAMNRANEHAMLSSYLNSLFGISNSGSGGSWPGGGV